MAEKKEKTSLFADDSVDVQLPDTRQLSKGLTIDRTFSAEGVDPFDSVVWERRDAVIKNHTGKAIFEQKDVEFPAGWSQLATNVVASKYFYGDLSRSGEHDRGSRRQPGHALQELHRSIAGPLAGRVFVGDDEHVGGCGRLHVARALHDRVEASDGAALPYVERLACSDVPGLVDEEHT